MGFFSQLRKMLQGPPHIQGGDDEGAAALHEDYGIAGPGETEMKQMSGTGGGGGSALLQFGASEATEAATDDASIESAPPDQDP